VDIYDENFDLDAEIGEYAQGLVDGTSLVDSVPVGGTKKLSISEMAKELGAGVVSPKYIKPKLKAEIRRSLHNFNEWYEPVNFSVKGDYFIIHHPSTGMYRGDSGDDVGDTVYRYLGYESPIRAAHRRIPGSGHSDSGYLTEWDFPEDIRKRLRFQGEREGRVPPMD